MKNTYTFLVLAFTITMGNAQIVNIPDANFKAKLLLANPSNMIASVTDSDENGQVESFNTIDTNGDGEIQVSEAQAIKYLNISESTISNVNGINSFTNLNTLYCVQNQIEILDVTALTELKMLGCDENFISTLDLTNQHNLQNISCSHNQMTILNISGLNSLTNIACFSNQLTTLDISNMLNLLDIDCSENHLTSLLTNGCINLHNLRIDDNYFTELDLSELSSLDQLDIWNNNQLIYLNIKNGSNDELEFGGTTTNLRYICVDDNDIPYIESYLSSQGIQNCQVNTYCNFTPGGSYYTVNGNTHVDYDNNGCDTNDLSYPNLNIAFTETDSGNIISDASGQFTLNLIPGSYIITPILENPSYFTVSPTSINVTFPNQVSPFVQNFCVTPVGSHKDLEITLVPLTLARPGFDSRYKLVYKNKANIPQSGNITFAFDDNKTDFVSSIPIATNQNVGLLSWDYINLLPFESREIIVTLNINSPIETPAVNAGDILNSVAIIYPIVEDELAIDNTSALKQLVVNSIDPNDKTCLEGTNVSPSMVGQYVHYMIRFENTGTANAENIVVKDMIDTTKYDINSLVPISGSASYVTRITDTNKVEFIFENINLPFEDANNDGYVAFKIKTKPTLVVGDTFSNTADIYFDYNFPITTNTETTIIQTLGTQDFEFSNVFSLSPVPAKNTLNITAKQVVIISSISIYNTLGQLIQIDTNPTETIDVSGLKTGSYFIKIVSDKGTSSGKFIKE